MKKEPTSPIRLFPALFSTMMVQAIEAGKKTKTRRLVKPQPWKENEYKGSPEAITKAFWREDHQEWWFTPADVEEWDPSPYSFMALKCPYGQPGDIIWVRETFRQMAKGFDYKADYPDRINFRWTPSIHMPFKACRHFLQVKTVKIERLQDITEEDAIAEGVKEAVCDHPEECISSLCEGRECIGKGTYFNYPTDVEGEPCYSALEAFEQLWEMINGKKAPWAENPWVWVIEFEKIDIKTFAPKASELTKHLKK